MALALSTIAAGVLAVVLLFVILNYMQQFAKRRARSKKGVTEAVADLDSLPPGTMKEVPVRTGEGGKRKKVLLVRTKGGDVHALSHKCPHYAGNLSKGVLCGTRLTCPLHAACFNVETGDIEDGPVVNKLRKYPASVKDGRVYVTTPANLEDMAPKGMQPSLCSHVAGDDRSFVIIGGGPAGLTAAQTLREEGFTGHITLITKENYLPYDRPKLSKDMSIKADRVLLRSPEWFKASDIRVFKGTAVVGVDSVNKTVTVQDGSNSRLSYDKLLCATGGAPRTFRPGERFTIEGATLGNIFPLRQLEHSHGIESAVNKLIEARGSREAVNVVILGSSFIGMEAAAYLATSKAGVNITVVGMEKEPFELALGTAVGQQFRAVHESKGITFRLRSVISKFLASEDDEAVVGGAIVKNLDVADSSEHIAADLVVVGAGIIPISDYLKDTEGIEFARDGSVIVNEGLKAVDDIYVAGDLANFTHLKEPGGVAQVRIEHWDVAMDLGRLAARNMLGKELEYKGVPFFWTGQFGKMMRYAGRGSGKCELVMHGSVDTGLVAYYIKAGAVAAVLTVNRDPVAVAAMELLRLGRMPSPAAIRAAESLDLVAYLRDISKALSGNALQ